MKMDVVEFEAVRQVLDAFTEGIQRDLLAGTPVPDKYRDMMNTIKGLNFTSANSKEVKE